MLVSQVLRGKGSEVATTPPDASIKDVLATLAGQGVGALVVSSDGETIEGIISERDIVRGLAESGAQCLDQFASELMTSEVVTTPPTASTEELMAKMSEGRFRHVPVVDDDKLAGIVSIGDIVKARVSELEAEREQLTDYISGR
jgi:CBS domain-containing protein